MGLYSGGLRVRVIWGELILTACHLGGICLSCKYYKVSIPRGPQSPKETEPVGRTDMGPDYPFRAPRPWPDVCLPLETRTKGRELDWNLCTALPAPRSEGAHFPQRLGFPISKVSGEGTEPRDQMLGWIWLRVAHSIIKDTSWAPLTMLLG